jgi:hypothetical protein
LSSILKALKKIEGEQSNQEKVKGLSRAVYRRKGNRSRKAGLTALVLVLCAGGFLGWFYIKNHEKKAYHASSEKISQPFAQKPVLPAAGHAAKPPMEKSAKPLIRNLRPLISPPLLSNETKVPIGNPGPKPTAEVIGQTATTASGNKDPMPVKEIGKASSSPLLPDNSRQNFEKEVEATASGIETSEKNDSSKDALAPPLENSDLKLQAIAWADDPKSRIAVISGSIVREGDSIGGMMITRINPEEILLSKGGEIRKLVFRLQQAGTRNQE